MSLLAMFQFSQSERQVMLTGQTINDLSHVQEVLEEDGFKTALIGEAVSFLLQRYENSFLGIITILENELTITCQIGEVSDDDSEAKLAELGIAALDLNFAIRPYAIAVVRGAGDKWPLVLTDSLSIGDLSASELQSSVENLRSAIHSCADFIRKISL